jgi:AcrR family transcriptional regulator
MSPRAYRMGARLEASQETRSRIIDASLRLLGAEDRPTAFTIDNVAREAGVARMTVYYQFNSRQGLLEAVYDELGARGLVKELPAVFHASDRTEALRAYVRAFFKFWAVDRLVMRRVRALARLDIEFEKGVHERDERRRHICRTVLALPSKGSAPSEIDDASLDLIVTLTSFETFDSLATPERDVESVITLIEDLVLRAAAKT